MKHLFRAVLILLVTAGMVSAAAFADNDQLQVQGDGGFAVSAPFGAAGIGGAIGYQQGDGISTADFGDFGSESQNQSQAQTDGYGSGGGGTFHGGQWISQQNQVSGSESSGGIAGNDQSQGFVYGSAGLTVGGQFGVAGSAGAAGGESSSFALGLAASGNYQDQTIAGRYEQQSVSANGGGINQSGESLMYTETQSGAFLIGAGAAEASVVQGGGTVAANNGVGTAMVGGSTSAGDASADASGAGLGGGSAEAYGAQTHEYTQVNLSGDGTSFQQASGSTTTIVQASD